MSAPIDPRKPPLVDKYETTERDQVYVLTCRVCRARWSLRKGSAHPGNLLALLNHHAGHGPGRCDDPGMHGPGCQCDGGEPVL